jgi:REP element-mobilizing transposase RayT
MSRSYTPGQVRGHDPEGTYFITFATVEWVDVFTRRAYKDILVDSLKHCQEKKGLLLYAWVIMSNHVHLIAAADEGHTLPDILRDLKKFTATQILKAIAENGQESRKDWMLPIFAKAGAANSNNTHFQFWRQDNRPVQLFTAEVFEQKLNYLHNNPVAEGYVELRRNMSIAPHRPLQEDRAYLSWSPAEVGVKSEDFRNRSGSEIRIRNPQVAPATCVGTQGRVGREELREHMGGRALTAGGREGEALGKQPSAGVGVGHRGVAGPAYLEFLRFWLKSVSFAKASSAKGTFSALYWSDRSVTMKPSYALAVSLMALSMVCRAQVQVPVDNEAYEAWKLSQIQHPQQATLPHPAASNTVTGALRGGGGEAPCACWIEPDSSYTTIDNSTQWNAAGWNSNDDGSYGPIDLPFDFHLYGDTVTAVYTNVNGNLTFGSIFGTTYTSTGFPISGPMIIAPFWADVDLGDPGVGNNKVQYRSTPTALYVNWTNVGYFNDHIDKVNSFQVIISDGTDPAIPGGNNVSFCYGEMQWTTGDASGGINGLGGTPATVGANQGNGGDYLQLGRFDHAGANWDGPFENSDGVGWLTDRHFSFSTASSAIPPIFSSIGCDTLEIEAGSSYDYPMMIIAGGPGQVITGSSSCPDIAGYMETSNTSGDVAEIVSGIVPTEDEVGVHTINYIAQNDADTPLVSTYTIYVKVLPGLTTGISSIGTSRSITMQPNPANDQVTVSWPAELRPTLVQVIAMDGSVVMSRTPKTGLGRMQLDIRSLSAGIYTVRVSGPLQVATTRLVRSGG